MKRRAISSDELLAELAKDPDWVAARKAEDEKRERHRVEFIELERPILADLRAIGVAVSTIGNAIGWERYVPLSRDIVDTLLRWLPRAPWRLKESLIRWLAVAKEPFEGKVLVDLFESVLAENLDELDLEEARAKADWGWVIGNTIAEARPFGITDWVIKTARNPNLNKSRETFMLAVARLAPAQLANEVLVPLFDEFPAHVAGALGECGGRAEFEFLRMEFAAFTGPTKTVMAKAIRRISKRLTREERALVHERGNTHDKISDKKGRPT